MRNRSLLQRSGEQGAGIEWVEREIKGADGKMLQPTLQIIASIMIDRRSAIFFFFRFEKKQT